MPLRQQLQILLEPKTDFYSQHYTVVHKQQVI